MIYHDVDRPPPFLAYPAALVALGLSVASAWLLARWSPPGGQLALAIVGAGGLMRSQRLAGVRGRIPMAAVALAVVVLFGESSGRPWTWTLLWFGGGVAADARWLEVSWPRRHLAWRPLLRGATATASALCAVGVLATPPAWLELPGVALGLGLWIAAISAGLWHRPPETVEVDGVPLAAFRERCPRCGTIADWPIDRPGACHRCGLKRRASPGGS